MEPRSERFGHPGPAGVTLHALHWGHPGRPVVVLLHGGGANGHWWDHIAPDLARDHHVIALDFRGHGDSDYPDELEVGAFNTDLEALCDHLDHRDLILVGHSMGAQVALDHASRFEETRKLVLIDPARGSDKRSSRKARLALSLARQYASREEAIEHFQFVPAAEGVPDPLRRHIASHSVRCGPDGTWRYKFDGRWFGVPPRARPDLSKVRCPCLVVRGAESLLLSAPAAHLLCEEIPPARLLE
ncbi:MAG: alpha/beta hydrolase, partial [Myxococcota bacterium]